MIPRLRRGKNQTNQAGKKERGWGERNFCPPSISAAAEFRANEISAPQPSII